MRKLLMCGVLLCAFALPSACRPRLSRRLVPGRQSRRGRDQRELLVSDLRNVPGETHLRFGSTAFCRVSGYAVPGYWAPDEPPPRQEEAQVAELLSFSAVL